MIGKLLKPELEELIRKRDFNELREVLSGFPAQDLAEILADLTPDDEAVLLRILPRDLAAEVFENLPVEDQENLVQALGTEQVAQILNDLSADDRTALLEELPAAITQKLLNLLTPEQRRIATELLGYPRDSIGRRMTPEYVAIQQDWSVAEVLAHLRRQPDKCETISQLYVVDGRGRLVDYVRLRKLVVAPLESPVSALLENQRIFLRAMEDQETAVAAFKKYDTTILAVVDSNEVLVGVVTVDDVLDVAEMEATEDIQKMGGVEALDAPYLRLSLFDMVRKRAGWLAVLFIGEMFTATAMGYFEKEIERAAVLAVFLPLILSSGGNSGSQATTLIIRAMALGDVLLRDWWRVFRRELTTGFLLGCILAVLGAVRILTWQWIGIKDYGAAHFELALAVGGSLIGVVLWGSLMGAMLPMVLRRCKLDPATCSAPFVATFVDVTGIVIYFTVAYFLFLSHPAV
ncbi:MAG: magnesium transporter [Verrucomicrobiae bacterium]|nr:magnesium transporter [Verrucomicrobiae bacterium]